MSFLFSYKWLSKPDLDFLLSNYLIAPSAYNKIKKKMKKKIPNNIQLTVFVISTPEAQVMFMKNKTKQNKTKPKQTKVDSFWNRTYIYGYFIPRLYPTEPSKDLTCWTSDSEHNCADGFISTAALSMALVLK